jgi:hypothetical protein
MDRKRITYFNTSRLTAAMRIVLASSMCLLASHALAEDNQPPADASPSTQSPDASAPPAQTPPAQAPPIMKEEAQPYVGRFLIYSGFMILDSPYIGLNENGVHAQAGLRWSRHISLGLDYSRGTGSTSVGLNLATPTLQKDIAPFIPFYKSAGLLPQNYNAALPFNSRTQTFTAGPEFPWRRWKRITPYIRPSCGFIYEQATISYNNLTPVEAHLIKLLISSSFYGAAPLAPSGKDNDVRLFYGVGGGMGINFTKHFSMVVQADFVHDHLFPSIIQNGWNTVRFSIGPGVQFGGNVTRHFIFH